MLWNGWPKWSGMGGRNQAEYASYVKSIRVLKICEPNGSLLRKLRTRSRAIDATAGNQIQSVIVLKTGHTVLSALQPGTIKERIRE